MLNPPFNIKKINGKVKSDNWGGKEYIAKLLSIEDRNKPYSEYWLGVHPLYPSTLINDKSIQLVNYLAIRLKADLDILSTKFPFLLKLLDVDKMLSIQLHPNQINSQKGFKQENLHNISLNEAYRIYKDPNPKYEALFAITDFYLLQDFLNKDLLIQTLERLFPMPLRDNFIVGGYNKLCSYILSLSREETKMITDNIISKIDTCTQYSKLSIEYWVSKYLKENPYACVCADKGLIFMYLLNLIKLNKEQVLYTKPGILHSYLQGQCTEIMSNSDNVIRLGLTKKNINHNEIVNNLSVSPDSPVIVIPDESDQYYKKYNFEESNFSFTIINPKNSFSKTLYPTNIEILLTLEGHITIEQDKEIVEVNRGEAIVVLPNREYTIKAQNHALIIIATSIASFT